MVMDPVRKKSHSHTVSSSQRTPSCKSTKCNEFQSRRDV